MYNDWLNAHGLLMHGGQNDHSSIRRTSISLLTNKSCSLKTRHSLVSIAFLALQNLMWSALKAHYIRNNMLANIYVVFIIENMGMAIIGIPELKVTKPLQ